MSEATQYVSEQGRASLSRIAEWLEAGAPHRTLNNGLAVDTFDMRVPVRVYEDCGTSCCIAGAVCQFEGLGMQYRDCDGDLDWTGYDGAKALAGDFLGMTHDDRTRLFEPWTAFKGSDNSFNSAQRGAAVIRHFLETGEVNWNRFDDLGNVVEESA